jgi:dihydroneopterin aldolase
MTDRVVLRRMIFVGRHGLTDAERAKPQPFEVDVELLLNLQPAGVDDDISKTVDYAQAFEICREVVESTNFRLIEAVAEGIAHELLTAFPVAEVGVRVRKPQVPIAGTLDHAEVEIWRARSGAPSRRRRGRGSGPPLFRP